MRTFDRQSSRGENRNNYRNDRYYRIIYYDSHSKNYHSLGISTVNKCKNNVDITEERDIIELDFGLTPNTLKEGYLEMHEGIQSEIGWMRTQI